MYLLRFFLLSIKAKRLKMRLEKTSKIHNFPHPERLGKINSYYK
jgi:hypothetical protein